MPSKYALKYCLVQFVLILLAFYQSENNKLQIQTRQTLSLKTNVRRHGIRERIDAQREKEQQQKYAELSLNMKWNKFSERERDKWTNQNGKFVNWGELWAEANKK